MSQANFGTIMNHNFYMNISYQWSQVVPLAVVVMSLVVDNDRVAIRLLVKGFLQQAAQVAVTYYMLQIFLYLNVYSVQRNPRGGNPITGEGMPENGTDNPWFLSSNHFTIKF